MKLPALSPRKRWLRVGFQPDANAGVDIPHALLQTHLRILGPPNSGKTRFLLHLFGQLTRVPNASIFMFNPKGDLCYMARDWCIAHGLTSRLDWFGPGDSNVMGYDPLRPNALAVSVHAKAVREGIRSAWGQSNFDQTAQLARWLFIVLFIARELALTLVEAVSLLRPDSQLRRSILPRIQDPHIQDALRYLDNLREQRQDELTAPALARLESFVLDPLIRRIIARRDQSVDLAKVLAGHRIFLANLEEYKPLRPDDVRLLGRLLLNDVIAHTFNRPAHERTPVYLLLDEVQTWITDDLVRCLDKGREMGLHVIAANQFSSQLETEETKLADSMLNCVRTTVAFGGLSVKELEPLTRELMIDQYNPWKIKDEIDSLECEPIERVRHVVTEGESTAQNLTRTHEVSEGQSRSQTQGQEQSQGRSLGMSREIGASETMGEAQTYTTGHVSTRGRASSSGSGSGTNYVSGTAESILPDGNGGFVVGGEVIRTSSESSSRSSNSFSSDTESTSEGDIETVGNAYSWTRGRSSSQGQNLTTSQTQGVSQSRTEGVQKGQSRAIAEGLTTGKSRSVTHTPFHEYKKRRIVSSRQFLSEQEQMTLALQKIKSQPIGHFLLKVPGHKAVFLRAPFVRTPWISERQRTKALERIFAQPHYASLEQIEIEEQERAQRIRALLPNMPSTPEISTNATLPAPEKPSKIKKVSSPLSEKKPQTPWEILDNTETHDKTKSEEEIKEK